VTGRLYDRYLREQGSSHVAAWPTASVTDPTRRPTSASNTSIHRMPWCTGRSATHTVAARSISPTRNPRAGLRDAGTYVDFTWAPVLNGLTGERTRLLVRTRGRLCAAGRQSSVPAAGTLRRHLRSRHMLRAIARRAEVVDSSPP
jgi:hypothetical protein